MKEYKLGTFFGQDIVLKSEEDFDWAKKWENYIEDLKKQAVREYEDELFFKEIENRPKPTFFTGLKEFLTGEKFNHKYTYLGYETK